MRNTGSLLAQAFQEELLVQWAEGRGLLPSRSLKKRGGGQIMYVFESHWIVSKDNDNLSILRKVTDLSVSCFIKKIVGSLKGKLEKG